MLDGGLGAALIARGLPVGHAPEAWNVERPELVSAVHREHVQAGSEAVHTNSFGAHPLRLARHDLEARCQELNAAAVRVARASGARFVIGDLGPAAAPGSPDDIEAGFALQIGALADAGADALHAETQGDLHQALAVLRAARQRAPRLAVIVSMTFARRPEGFVTLDGRQPAECFAALREEGADAVGANCWITSADMAELARQALADGGLRLVVQPCAGQPRATEAGLVYPQAPEDFARELAPLVPRLAGVGGCCGTDARHLRALAARAALPVGAAP